MSRLNSLSQSAIRAMFASETQEAIILLLTISDPGAPDAPIRIADGYTGRLETKITDEEIVYGVRSNGKDYVYLPMELGLPGEEEAGSAQCTLTIKYVLPEAIQLIRERLTSPVSVQIDLVLSNSPDRIETSFSGFRITRVSYNADQITFDLNMISLNREPFPCYTFTPANFPGLF